MLSNVINHASNQVEGFCFIKSLQLKVNVKGAEYLYIMLADADGEINAKLWDYQSAVHGMYSAGEVIKVRGTINLYKDTEQLKIDRIRHITEADHVDMSSIVASAPIDGEKIFDSLFEFAGGFADADIAKLTQYLLTENRERMLYYPAALKLHHAHRGGLMYHTSTMLDTAKQVVSVYGLRACNGVHDGGAASRTYFNGHGNDKQCGKKAQYTAGNRNAARTYHAFAPRSSRIRFPADANVPRG